MFDAATYKARRKKLKEKMQTGIIYFPGNDETPMNYKSNELRYRQDSCFLYYFGIDAANFNAVIDCDNDEDILFGDDRSLDDVVWMGPDTSTIEKARMVGIEKAKTSAQLARYFEENQGRRVHYLPQYRADNILKIEHLLGIKNKEVASKVSIDLIKAVIEQRSVKSVQEQIQIEEAVEISYAMNTLAMKMTKPGIVEREVCGAVEGMALSMGNGISFPIIFSVRGETLHNHMHHNIMNDGDMLILDSGAESLLHYASDITRAFPVNGKFSEIQAAIYNTVLKANLESIAMIEPGKLFKDIHMHAAKVIATGLSELGIMKGNIDEAVAAGAHALFMPHGLGHALGLDVHDMEGLGENYVGYNDDVKRSDQFGLAYLRFGKKLVPGNVMTIEPGCYFIPQLIANWKNESKHSEFINYDKAEEMIGFGGVRIEDDVVVTDQGNRVLGVHIPKTIDEIEEVCNS